jgi:hypothetical protein
MADLSSNLRGGRLLVASSFVVFEEFKKQFYVVSEEDKDQSNAH